MTESVGFRQNSHCVTVGLSINSMVEPFDQKAGGRRAFIGCDLGATFSRVAVFDPSTRTASLIPYEDGNTQVPSAVFFPESGEPIIGEAAINAGWYAPQRLVRHVKAFMGTNWRARIGGREYSPAEISGEILKVLRRNAETYLGITERDLAGVVLAVPAYFSDAAIQATLEAAVLGGFDRNKVRLFPEPSAVALCYTAESLGEPTSGSRRMLVSDLGGVAYDATIIDAKTRFTPAGCMDMEMRIVSMGGSQHLGGESWDDALGDYVRSQCHAEDGHFTADGTDPGTLNVLRERVIRAKEVLSRVQTAKVCCCPGHYLEVSREEFESCTDALAEALDHELRAVVERAREEEPGAPAVPILAMLAGGGSNMPRIRALVHEIARSEPLLHRSPEQTVVLGAAYQAGHLSGLLTVREAMCISPGPVIASGSASLETWDSLRVEHQIELKSAIYGGQLLNNSQTSVLTPAPELPPSIEFESVHYSITAPASLRIDSVGEMRFWAHLESQRNEVLGRAKQSLGLHEDFDLLMKSEGPFHLRRGAILSVSVKIEGLVTTPRRKTLLWSGDIGCAAFLVTVPYDARVGTHAGLASIRMSGAEIAQLHFVLTVNRTSTATDTLSIGGDLRHHRRAFASYASEDRESVIARVQGMESAYKGLSVFLDAAALRAGQNWEREIWQTISRADVFYLFWCRHALNSPWVEREWRYALNERGLDFIDPVPLESPEFAPPPTDLASKHFNDPWLVHIAGTGHAQVIGNGESQ